MNTSTRYMLIVAACAKLGCGPKLQGVIFPHINDLREEASLAIRGQDDGALPIDDDLPALNSRLNFDRLNAAREDEPILTPAERKQAKRDQSIHRLNTLIKRDLSQPRNLFALAII